MLAELDPKTKSLPNNTREGATPILIIYGWSTYPLINHISFPYKALLNSYFWGGGVRSFGKVGWPAIRYCTVFPPDTRYHLKMIGFHAFDMLLDIGEYLEDHPPFFQVVRITPHVISHGVLQFGRDRATTRSLQDLWTMVINHLLPQKGGGALQKKVVVG